MYTLNCKGILLSLEKPVIMGILNITEDSFYKGYLNESLDNIYARAMQMLNDGASIIDIGGQSTRPGAKKISEKEEADRILPVIDRILKDNTNIILSVDTFYASVAKQAVELGARIVNDVSGGNMDDKMIETVAGLNVPYVCMHMKDNPTTMQNNPIYDDVVKNVLDFFIQKKNECLTAGIKDLIIDPGFGFGKTSSQNFELLKKLQVFKILELPILIGISRKSMIYKNLGIGVENALNGTTVLNSFALQNKANILRVHDVKEAHEAITLFNLMEQNKEML